MWLVSEKVLSSSIIATSSIAITYCVLILLSRLLTSSTISLLAISEIYNITPLVLLTLPILIPSAISFSLLIIFLTRAVLFLSISANASCGP
jgi:hypothetical protein